MFREKLKADLDKLSPNEDTKALILENLKQKPKSKVFTFKTTSIIAACLAVVLAIGVVASLYTKPIDELAINGKLDAQYTTQEKSSKPNKNNSAVTVTTTKKKADVNTVYDKIYNLINKKYKENKKYSKGELIFKTVPGANNSFYNSDEVVELNEAGTSTSKSKDFSTTNTQHANVDEEDIIKTDGEYIYRLKEDFFDEIVIYKANAKNSKKVSTIDIAPLLDDYYQDDDWQSYASGIYLYKDKLVVVYDTYTKIFAMDCKCKYCTNKNFEDFAQIFIFDVSNKSNPKFVKQFKQSGFYDDSRIIDGKLYVSSNYYISPRTKIKKKEKTRYLPLLCDGETQKYQREENIYFADDTSSSEYTVICSYDVSKVSRVDDISIFGQNEIAYVSENNIYLTEEVYNDSYDTEKTKVTRLSISNGVIDKKESGKFSGEILNQFSMDEYKGYLRLVATQDSWKDDSYNSLCILDSSMNVVSSINKLAKGERIYSARFMGDYAYFVTFKETDPLFCADLSNPKEPKILSKLKIPGFSDYLHPFGKNKLFGFGQSATKKGTVTGLKLSMFDITDKSNILEENVLDLGNGYSQANYNHKAILVSDKKNLIAFAVQTLDYDVVKKGRYRFKGYYHIYSYTKKDGFKQMAKIEIYNMSKNKYYYSYEGGEIRGLYIDNYFYISNGESLMVVDLDTFEVIKTV